VSDNDVMAKCKNCSQEISWDEEIRRGLGINKPAQLVNGEYVQHDCPYYKSSNNPVSTFKKTPSSNISSSNYKTPNPNNYTGSTADYVNKSSQQQQQVETPLTINALKEIIGNIDVTQDVEFLRTVVMGLVEKVEKMQIAFDNFVRDNPAYRAQLEFQARMFPVLNQLEQKYLRQGDFEIADKIQQRFKENFDADLDPDYDQEYKDSIKGKEVEDV
jgi:hypothetical protein